MTRVRCPSCTRQFRTAEGVQEHQRATHENPRWVRERERRAALIDEPPQKGEPTSVTAARDARNRAAPICPKCSKPATMSVGRWGIRADCCGLWSWKGKPLVDRETHAARIHAHEAFDRIWKSGTVHRQACYARLAALMGMTRAECHIAQMSAAQCREVVALVARGLLVTEGASG